ncbi:MAG: signal recognition particle-docking protein FtsY, partial [Nitrosopumilaceae archaeon]
LAGNDTVNQAREFHQYTKFEGVILTKSDADARGGAAISIVKVTSAPILYLGVGQEYKDLKTFDKESFLETLFGEAKELPQQIPTEVQAKSHAETFTPTVEETKQQVKAEPSKQEIKAETKSEPKLAPQKDEDPFAGIATKDIEKYSELFDVPPPGNDKEAIELATKIKKWISQGRPKVGKESSEEETLEQEDTKTKKKRSVFGWGRK